MVKPSAAVYAAILIVVLFSSTVLTRTVMAGETVWESDFDFLVSTDDPDGIKHVEPHFDASKTNPDLMVAGVVDTHEGALFPSSEVTVDIYKSANNAETWQFKQTFPKVDSRTNRQADPIVTSDASSTSKFYMVVINHVASTACNEFPSSIDYISTTDGDSYSSAVSVVKDQTCLQDKPFIKADSIATSPYKNNVYVCWADTSNNGYTIKAKRILPTASTTRNLDSGTSGNLHVNGCAIDIGPDGQVYVVWTKMTSTSAGQTRISRSYDGGGTFTTAKDAGSFTRQVCNSGVSALGCVPGINSGGTNKEIRAAHWPSVVADPVDGNVHIVYRHNGGTTMSDIRFVQSTNCETSTESCTFGSPATINIDNTATDQWMPAMTYSDKTKALHVLVLDRRDDSANVLARPYEYHCHIASSCTTPTNWAVEMVSPQTLQNSDGSPFVGEYHNIISTSKESAIAMWVDHREAADVQDYDIFADRTEGGLQVYAEDCTGTYINGMSVSVYNSGGNLIQSGFTPMYVDIPQPGSYLLKYANYQNNTFVSSAPLPSPVTSYAAYSWGGDVNLSLNDHEVHEVEGIYNTSGGSSCGTTGTIQISSERKDNGGAITGLYVQLTNSQGQEIANGFTPVTFTQSAGTYTAYPNDFAPYVFDHWEDNGSTVRGRAVNLAADAHWELKAVYRIQ